MSCKGGRSRSPCCHPRSSSSPTSQSLSSPVNRECQLSKDWRCRSSRDDSDLTPGIRRTGRGGGGYRPIFEFQYAQERGSMIPGGAWSSASRKSSSETYRRMERMSSGSAYVIAYAMNRIGSLSAFSAGSNHTMRRASSSVSGVTGMGFTALARDPGPCPNARDRTIARPHRDSHARFAAGMAASCPASVGGGVSEVLRVRVRRARMSARTSLRFTRPIKGSSTFPCAPNRSR